MPNPCIFVEATALSDETVLLCLHALEQTAWRGESADESDPAQRRVVAAGMVLAAEAWKRGLISAPKPEEG